MRRHNKNKRQSFNGKNFIILPIVFCAVIYLTLFFVVSPSASSFISMGSLFFSDREKDFSEEYNNIFVPVEEETQTSASNENEEGEPSDSDHSGSDNTTQNSIAISDITFPKYSEQFGELIIEDCQINARLFFGDNNIALSNGVGIYNGSSIPGYGKTILVAGHNNTYFNGLKYAQPGQIVKIRTSYGNYYYEITDVQIKEYNDSSAYDLNADSENLIMYTCYPFDELGLTSQRCFVYAKPLQDSNIDKNR